MADFSPAYKRTAKFEGGFVNHPNDPGGMTFAGVARKRHPEWQGWGAIDSCLRRGVIPRPEDAAWQPLLMSFYKKNFWDVVHGDAIKSQVIANELYDIAVLQGVGTAATIAQRTVNVLNKRGKITPDLKVDGNFGPATVTAINACIDAGMEAALLKYIDSLRGAEMIEDTEKNNKLEDFAEGWANHRLR